jgi:cytochrome c556
MTFCLGSDSGSGRPANFNLPTGFRRPSLSLRHREFRIMLRKWMVFALSAGVLIAIAGASFSADDEETELGKVMEKVNKQSASIKKGVRNLVNFNKSHKDVAKASKELVKLAKEAKPLKDALGKAKSEANPQQKWNELMDAFIDKAEKLGEVVGKSSPDFDDTKKAVNAMNKSCTDCHQVFRVDETNF